MTAGTRTGRAAGHGTDVDPDRGTAAVVAALDAVVRDPARRPLLVALDVDGTLAPLVDGPDASRALPAAVAALRALATAPDVTLVLVSGRPLGDLSRRVEVPVGTVLVGSHGGERGRVAAHGLVHDPVRLTAEQDVLLVRVGSALLRAARGRDGVWVQHKPAGAVLHTRLAEPDDAAAATREALAVATGLGLPALRGTDVVEVPVLQVTTGQALLALRREVGAATVLHAGDGSGDAHALRDLDEADLTVTVGPGGSAARYRVPDPETLGEVLAALAVTLTG